MAEEDIEIYNTEIKIYKNPIVPWILFFVACAVIVWLLFLLHTKNISAPSQQNQTAAIIAVVGKLMVLPTDETPTIATVTDLSQLAGQPFFANAKVGDEVLIYTKAQKAILYDPTANKIINLAPLDTSENQSEPTASTSAPQ